MKHGFSLNADSSLPPAAGLHWESQLPPHSSALLPVTWSPQQTGPVAQLLSLKLDGKHQLQVRLIGTAISKAAADASKVKRKADQRRRRPFQPGYHDAPAATGTRPPQHDVGSTGPSSPPADTCSAVSSSGRESCAMQAQHMRAPGKPAKCASAQTTSRSHVRQHQPAPTPQGVRDSFRPPARRPAVGGSLHLNRPTAAAAAAPCTPRRNAPGSPVTSAASLQSLAGSDSLQSVHQQRKLVPHQASGSVRAVKSPGLSAKTPSTVSKDRKSFKYYHTE